jgi:hypothetical protein
MNRLAQSGGWAIMAKALVVAVTLRRVVCGIMTTIKGFAESVVQKWNWRYYDEKVDCAFDDNRAVCVLVCGMRV